MEQKETEVETFVIAYERKSPDEAGDTKTSIDNQDKIIRNSCIENKWTLVKVFIDPHVSGSDRNRKELLDALKFLEVNPNINILCVKDQDRFARDSSFFKDSLQKLENRGKRVYDCMQRKFLSYEDLGDNVRAMMDGHYITQQRKKALKTLEIKRREGKPIGNPIFGYRYNFKYNSNGTKIPINQSLGIDEWIIDEKNQKIVLSVVSDYVNNVNFATTIKDLGIDKSKYYRIIKNAKNGLYSGFVIYELKKRDPDKSIAGVEEVRYKGRHSPIISEELYQKVMAKNGV